MGSAAAALLVVAALAAGAPPTRAQLEALEARRRAEEAAARMLAQQERSVLDTLAEAEEALGEAEAGWRRAEAARAEAEWRRAEAARAEAEATLARAREEERAAEARQRSRLAELRPRLLARERLGRTGEVQILLSSGSLADLVKRRWLMDRILSRDLQLLEEAQAAKVARERARATRQREAARLGALAAEAAAQRDQARARREERETLLSALRSARAFHERAAAELAAQATRLAALVGTLPSRAAGGAPFASLRGRLPLPAAGPIVVGFGRVVNPKFNTVTVQNGVDIAARPGAPVRAVAPGRVVHAGWFKGYGNLVIVDHGDGYHSLVAHLATMQAAMGEEVAAGSVLGTVGDSGSLKGAYLYFEIRERGRPVDPNPWFAP